MSSFTRSSWPLFAIALATTFGCSSASSDGPKTAASNAGDGGATTTTGTPTTTTPGTMGELCSSSAPCATGLSCAQGGDLDGRCTADCSQNLDLCTNQFGSNTVCMNEATCALLCVSPSGCPGEGQCVALSSGQSACASNPNGLPDAGPPPGGACWNLGGAFGDTVPNGGYRCTPTTGQDAPTTIDECQNGVWTSAVYTCACDVQSAPSNCFDFTSPGTAQCSYGVDSCAQCVSPAGCQTE